MRRRRLFEDRYRSDRLTRLRIGRAGLGEDELEPSDLILPPTDITLAEAQREFTGEGLIPD